MFLKKTILFIIIMLFICVSALWAGDTAVFVDLGFSADGRTYMFGQHGVELPSLRPWADIYVVDVRNNVFVPNGRVTARPAAPINAGQDGSGVLHRLVSDNASLTNRHGINFQNQGLPLYISRNENPQAFELPISFRNFLTGITYTAQLIPRVISGQNGFHINLEARNTQTGQLIRNYSPIGTSIGRTGIVQYNIKRVIIDANNSSMIFVIEMRRAAASGFDIRYMVEAVRL